MCRLIHICCIKTLLDVLDSFGQTVRCHLSLQIETLCTNSPFIARESAAGRRGTTIVVCAHPTLLANKRAQSVAVAR